jgi:cyclopropane fatty-acyl-phospholipid synthase-like methyltransferase
MKRRLIRILYWIDERLMISRARFKNWVEYRTGRRTRFNYDIFKLFLRRRQGFGVHQFYQSYPALGIRGARDTLNRQHVYGLQDILKPDMDLLDIGSNVGFFSIALADRVKQVDLLEYEPELAEIASLLKDKEGKDNVTSICGDFKAFDPGKKYDLIFSFAIHWWVGLSLGEYLKRIRSHLKEQGLILIESHTLTYGQVSDVETELASDSSLRVLRKGTTDDQSGGLRDFFLVTPAAGS